ncbi:MAG: multiple sugar transport system substrate-binding protein [Thermosipho sp. (in: thermotogales)]|jgi:multiple sugar transport system substrate-binding protein|nr:multiple sugar transport system substrate-binding protein [Thermosipho sp. (in: thermotogales)]
MDKQLKVLAVDDPAVYVYVDDRYSFLKEFTKKTGVKIYFDIVKWVDYYSTLMNSFREYKYDIVMIAGHLWMSDFVEKGNLLELSGDFELGYDYEDIIPSIRQEIEYNGKKYLLPSFCDGHILLYRKSKIKENIADEISIDELIELVENNADKQKSTFVLKAHPSEIFLDFLPYLRNEGIDAFDHEGKPLFDNQKGYVALEKYINMKQYCPKNVAEFGNEEVLNAIQKDKCKLGVSWSGQLGKIMNDQCINPEEIGFASLETSWNTTWSFGINHLCQDQLLAERFLQFITTKDVDKVVGAYCGNPTRKSSFEHGKEKYRWYPVVQNMLERSKPLPHLPFTGQLIDITTKEIVKAFEHKISPQQALRNAASIIEREVI